MVTATGDCINIFLCLGMSVPTDESQRTKQSNNIKIWLAHQKRLVRLGGKMIPKFESKSLTEGVVATDEKSKARLEEWRGVINNLPGTQDFELDTCDREGGLLIQGALDVGFDERSHDVFYKFYQGDRALLDAGCDCRSGSLCPARQAISEMDGTWSEVYAKMVSLIKDKAEKIPPSPA